MVNTPSTLLLQAAVGPFICGALLIFPFAHAAGQAPEPSSLALSAFEFGGSVAKLVWTATATSQKENNASAYVELANKVKTQIDIGRASSGLVQANFNLIATAIEYGAIADPEPFSKAVAGIAAWGAKKTGDAVGSLVLDEVQKQATAVLAKGLQNANFSPAELAVMTPAELRERVADLKVGGQAMRDILAGNPAALSMLQANAMDIATNIGVEALAKAEGTAKDVQGVRESLGKTQEELASYQAEVSNHLSDIETKMTGLEEATEDAGHKLDSLKEAVEGQEKAISSLSAISFSGWTTSQKLQAVESGLFPDLSDSQTAALTESLKADIKQERLIADVEAAGRDFGNIASIAQNLGLPRNIVEGAQKAQVIASGVAQFATGNYLGAVTSATSLVGLGSPDAGASRHAEMMGYLQNQFAVVNQKLDRIIDLQIRTLKVLNALAVEQREFKKEVLGQLDRIEGDVLRSERILQAIMLGEWKECYALINGTALNGQFALTDREVLFEVLRNQNTPGYASKCYATMSAFLDAWVKPAQWSGQIIAAGNFPASVIADNDELQKSWLAFEYERNAAYVSARDFVKGQLTDAATSPAPYLARFGQPVANAYGAKDLRSVLIRADISARLSAFRCDQTDVLAASIKDLICFGRVHDAPERPLVGRWSELINAALTGPHAFGIVDTGIVLAQISNFAIRDSGGTFSFVSVDDVAKFNVLGMTPEMLSAVRQRKGSELLSKLQWLTEAEVLQQSIAYGDYTAELAEGVLYDKSTRAINVEPNQLTPPKLQALLAMSLNPILARNVVTLAVRHAVADGLGGEDKAEAVSYEKTYYHLGITDVRDAGCHPGNNGSRRLADILPNWKFEYRVTAAEKATAELKDCPEEFKRDIASATPVPDRGAGIAVSLGNFYVLAPSPLDLAAGRFVQSDSLRLALVYRDRTSQAKIDLEIAAPVHELGDSKVAAEVALGVLNEGWAWQGRSK